MRRLALTLLLTLPGGDERDRVVLANGKELRGRVLLVDAEHVLLRRSGRDQELARREVETVERIDAQLDQLLADARPSRLTQKSELEALAGQALAAGLGDEARLFWWRLLLLDPDSSAAHAGLGHRRAGGSFAVPLDGRSVSFAQRVEAAKDWGSAWKLTSLHYEFSSNLPLERTLDAMLDLERLYRAFFALFGPALALREVVTPMKIHLHADRASYPQSAGEFGRYEPETDTVVVDASGGFQLATLVHEATHQLLFVTAFKERGGQGEIPPWLNEGLAEYVAQSVVGAPPLAFQAGKPALHHFRVHAGSADAHDLTRVLSFGTTDYQAGSDQALKYAQSYTLVHFLLHGEGEQHRAGFLAFLRLVYAGRGSSSDLKKCLDTDWKKLERAWSDYARAQAL